MPGCGSLAERAVDAAGNTAVGADMAGVLSAMFGVRGGPEELGASADSGLDTCKPYHAQEEAFPMKCVSLTLAAHAWGRDSGQDKGVKALVTSCTSLL